LQFGNEFDRVHNCVAEYTMHGLSLCYGLFTALVLLNNVARWRNNFFKKWCNLACLCAWASEGFFPGGHKWIFPKVFLGRQSGKIYVLPLELRKPIFF